MDPPPARPSVLSAEGLWGDTQFSDATIILGDSTWKVHRWVICRQSEYFMRALEGEFKEAKNKTIVLMESNLFKAEDVDSMLKFLYSAKFQKNQMKHPVKTYLVGDYFRIQSLRAWSIVLIKQELEYNIAKGLWQDFCTNFTQCLSILAGSDVEKAAVQVAAAHARTLINEPAVMWDDIVIAHPSLASLVLKAAFPKPHPQSLAARGSAFDDTRRPQNQVTQATPRGSARVAPY